MIFQLKRAPMQFRFPPMESNYRIKRSVVTPVRDKSVKYSQYFLKNPKIIVLSQLQGVEEFLNSFFQICNFDLNLSFKTSVLIIAQAESSFAYASCVNWFSYFIDLVRVANFTEKFSVVALTNFSGQTKKSKPLFSDH